MIIGTKMTTAFAAIAVCLVSAAPAFAQADPPSLMQLQGRLTDSAGQPITSTTRDLRVEFYNSAVGGLLLGSYTEVDPTMTNGIYSVSITPPAGVFANNVSVFMEMAVGSGVAGADPAFEVLSPRTRVLASAYALNADTLDGRDSSFFAQASSGFVQGGNTFGALATLGTNDAFDLVLETAGLERMRVLGSGAGAGRVGIGTASPIRPLHLYTAGALELLALESAGESTAVEFYEAGVLRGLIGHGAPIVTGGLPDSMALRASGALHLTAGGSAVRMTLDTNGNLGIGTNSPADRLHVMGSIRMGGTGTYLYSPDVGMNNRRLMGIYLDNRLGIGDEDHTGGIYLQTSGFIGFETKTGAVQSERMRITNAGNVGIGTSAPATRLHVQNGSGTFLRVGADGTNWAEARGDAGGRILNWVPSADGAEVFQFRKADGNTTILDVDTFNQRVGVNTTAPARGLHVADRGPVDDFQSKLRVGNGTPAQEATVDIVTNDGARILQAFDDNNLTTPRFVIERGGNVGIGTATPGARLTVVAGATTDTLGANGASEGFDIAEAISAAGDVEVADLVSVDPATSQRVVRSRVPYDPTLLGVTTSQPAIAIGATDGNRHIALAGRVAVRVICENGPVRRGDYLTSSSRAGAAMKANGPGRVVGVALGEFDGDGEGRVVVYVSPGWWDGGRTAEQEEENAALRDRVRRLEDAVGRLERLVEAKEAGCPRSGPAVR